MGGLREVCDDEGRRDEPALVRAESSGAIEWNWRSRLG